MDMTPEDRALVELAREGHEPTSTDRTRVRAALAVQLGVGVGLVSTSAGAGGVSVLGSSVSAMAVKIVAVVTVVGGLSGAGVVAYRSANPSEKRAAAVAPSVVAATMGVPSVPPEAPASTQAASDGTSDMFRSEVSAPRGSTGSQDTRLHIGELLSSPRPQPNSLRLAPGPADEEPSAPGIDHGATGHSESIAAPSEFAAGSNRVSEPVGPPDLPRTTLERETQLLAKAVSSLHSGEAASALVLLDEHARLFPTGALAPERMVERISALCVIGRLDEARSAATTFLRTHGGSPLVDRVRASCVGRLVDSVKELDGGLH